MYNGKTVTTDFIINKIQSAYSFTRGMDKFDIAEHIFDAMDLMGVRISYVHRITDGVGNNPDVITIEDYSGILPCDLFQIQGVRTHDTKISLTEDTSVYKPTYKSFDDPNASFDTQLKYYVNDNYIYVNYETGELEMSYLAFPTDKNGLPLIPDDTRYINGIVAYVAERIGFSLWWTDQLADKKYAKLETERLWYIPSGASSLLIPSYDKAEALKNMLNRMMQSSDQHRYGFKFLNSQEQLINHSE
jgi:hypothetical protein